MFLYKSKNSNNPLLTFPGRISNCVYTAFVFAIALPHKTAQTTQPYICGREKVQQVTTVIVQIVKEKTEHGNNTIHTGTVLR